MPVQDNKRQKVIMTLTSGDVANANKLQRWSSSRSKAAAVSKALSLSTAIIDEIDAGKDLYVRNKNGDFERLIITKR
ncbi:hypothetical protein [Acanthopleuribacter pedis]|uniref:Uncharacterized protein n=1 Tax=Acanthopleuribacter pedis TaxID=442870 RepID=A0A8J7Q1Z8_9BACT|nr:hypothetical protein [Acanthopleuribacter pedis]MBO1319012.1 hypothetical protein [Acanthopleuribacter pedis]